MGPESYPERWGFAGLGCQPRHPSVRPARRSPRAFSRQHDVGRRAAGHRARRRRLCAACHGAGAPHAERRPEPRQRKAAEQIATPPRPGRRIRSAALGHPRNHRAVDRRTPTARTSSARPSTLLPPAAGPKRCSISHPGCSDDDADALAARHRGPARRRPQLRALARSPRRPLIRASGWVLGSGTALRLRPAITPAPTAVAAAAPIRQRSHRPRHRPHRARQPRQARLPARCRRGKLVFANAAYHDLARALGRKSSESQPAELLDFGLLQRNRAILGDARARRRRW